MSNLVIVAIPREDDPVWKISSEKVPHMTILFLGEGKNPNLTSIAGFLAHTVSLPSITRFGLDVERRGELGDDKADVLFFEDNWELPRVREYRDLLLQDNNIQKAYNSVEQYPEWTPHLTLGYPESPAKPTEYPISWVQFDRIALWDGDSEGLELILKRERYMDIAMSDTSAAGRQFLAHYGVKGMKWGVRKQGPTAVTTTESTGVRGKARVKAEGGEGQPAHPDAVKAATKKQTLKKSGASALSDQDLRDIITRAQLESQAKQAVAGKGSKFVKRQLEGTANQQTSQFINELASKQRRKVT